MLYNIPSNLGYVDSDPSNVLAWEANVSEENRIKFVTDLAAISRGKSEANNPEKRYQHLLQEAAPNTMLDAGLLRKHASRPLEFLKVKINYYIEICNGNKYVTLYDKDRHNIIIDNYPYHKWLNDIVRYSYAGSEVLTYTEGHNKGDTYYTEYLITNMRALLNAGIPYEKIPYNKEGLGKYGVRAVKIKAPMFVFNQLMTHTAFSKEARSERVTKLDPSEYWLPYDFVSKLHNYVDSITTKVPEPDDPIANHIAKIIYYINGVNANLENKTTGDRLIGLYNHSEDIKNKVIWYMVNKMSTIETQDLLHTLGYQKEIYQRAMLELRYKEWVMVGTVEDSSTWEHLFLERNATDAYKNWTQEETRLVVKTIKEALEDARNTRLGETNIIKEEDIEKLIGQFKEEYENNLELQSSGKLDISDYVNDINDRKN